MKFSYLPTKNGFGGMAVEVRELNSKMRSDKTPMMQIAAYLDQWVQVNFSTAGGNVGGWEPFMYGGRLTVKRKANAKSISGHRWIDGSARLEMRTGALRASFLPFYDVGEAGIGSDLPYAQYQSEGTPHLPARRMLPVNDDVAERAGSILDAWVAGSTRP